MFDILLKNSRIVDGTGNPVRYGDVGIAGEQITAVGNLAGCSARRVIDASGKLICPGFIDAHSHTDVTVEMNPFFESTISQGVTTEIVGNCGNSAAPLPETGDAGGFGNFNGKTTPCVRSLGEHMAALESTGMSANLAWLVGHNTLRTIAGVKSADVTPEQYEIMERDLRKALEDGAIGMSSGLEFEPGRNSHPEELLRLTKVLAEYDAIYTSHIRNRDANVLEALDEFLDVLRHNKLRGQVSHMNIRHDTNAPTQAMQRCIEKIERARSEGCEVLTDMTPLNYGIGQMAGILPTWLTALAPDELRPALLNPEVRARLRGECDRYWRFIHKGQWGRVRMQSNPGYPELNGKTFLEIAAFWNKDPWDCYFDILATAAPAIGSVVLVSYLFTDSHLRETISHPLYMLVVDGYSTSAVGAVASHTQFPLHYIGMAWFLTHHVREMHTLSLEEAIRKMTSMPAAHFRLGKRGLLCEGYIADLCVFEFENLKTPFDLQNPAQYTEGMDYVFVAGKPVLDGGEHCHATPGRNIKRSPDKNSQRGIRK